MVKDNMKTVKATYEISGETDKYEVRCIECPHCKNAEELPDDEQRWHYQHFEFVDMEQEGDTSWYKEQDKWFYKCLECFNIFIVDWNEKKEKDIEFKNLSKNDWR
jgi:hypothetical protein